MFKIYRKSIPIFCMLILYLRQHNREKKTHNNILLLYYQLNIGIMSAYGNLRIHY
mgnify:CR=1 FL=1